jgi:hypothetical protein
MDLFLLSVKKSHMKMKTISLAAALLFFGMITMQAQNLVVVDDAGDFIDGTSRVALNGK